MDKKKFDVSTRKTLTATCNHHPHSAVERLYLSLSAGGTSTPCSIMLGFGQTDISKLVQAATPNGMVMIIANLIKGEMALCKIDQLVMSGMQRYQAGGSLMRNIHPVHRKCPRSTRDTPIQYIQ